MVKQNNAKSADKSNFWKSSHYLALREQVEKILANIAPTNKRQSDADWDAPTLYLQLESVQHVVGIPSNGYSIMTTKLTSLEVTYAIHAT